MIVSRASVRLDGPTGFELWSGPSEVDGAPIGVVVTHLQRDPQNRKLGHMSQAWILPRDTSPNEAVRGGQDRAVCGDCRFRPTNAGGCYVPIFSAPHRVWWAWRQFETYQPVEQLPRNLGVKPIRIGAWGDPSAVPPKVWEPLLDAVPDYTSYTHRWRQLDVSLWGWCMASVDSVSEKEEANAAGWRTFRVRGPGDPLLPDEVVCPAAEEAKTHGRVVCASCKLCNGIRRNQFGMRDRLQPRNISIIVHGQAFRRAELALQYGNY